MYNIPGDTGHPWRLNKFVEYQHEVPSIHYRTLGEYIKRNKLSEDDAVYLSWLMSVTYNEVTCILIFELLDWRTMRLSDVSSFWIQYKPLLNFGSARKYAKNMDWFIPLMDSFMRKVKRHPYEWIKNLESQNPLATYTHINRNVLGTQYVGRFAADLFMEMVVYLSKIGVLALNIKTPFELDWRKSSNLTSGLYNIFYMDDCADTFDKTKTVNNNLDEVWLLQRMNEVQKAIHVRYPEQDDELAMFVGKICSFRNLFKKARYGGFHHDRQLGVIREYEQSFPGYQHIWDELYKLRADMFHPRFLGELGGWDGIRKERKKLWVTQGLTGVEDI